MEILSVKLPTPLASRLEAFLRRRGGSKSEFVREAIERHLADPGSEKGSVLDRVRDLEGAVAGPKDLSTNPRHLKDYGR